MKSDLKYLHDMMQAALSIENYQTDSFDDFSKDEKIQDAIMYNLIIMGEAAKHISQEYQDQHPQIPWASIIGTRNIIVHGYDQIKLQIVWDIIENDIQSLKINMENLIN